MGCPKQSKRPSWRSARRPSRGEEIRHLAGRDWPDAGQQIGVPSYSKLPVPGILFFLFLRLSWRQKEEPPNWWYNTMGVYAVLDLRVLLVRSNHGRGHVVESAFA